MNTPRHETNQCDFNDSNWRNLWATLLSDMQFHEKYYRGMAETAEQWEDDCYNFSDEYEQMANHLNEMKSIMQKMQEHIDRTRREYNPTTPTEGQIGLWDR